MNSTELAVESLQQLRVIREIDEAGAQQRPHEREHREQQDETLLIEPSPGVAGQHQESGPAPGEGPAVSPIASFVDRHGIVS